MKRFISLLFALVLTVSVAAAEIDLSGMSYAELILLQRNLVAEIMSRPEWKEVTVPAGTWNIGTDIPAGYYSISPKLYDNVVVFEVFDSKGESIMYESVYKEKIIGKQLFPKGGVFECNSPVILAPALSLDF